MNNEFSLNQSTTTVRAAVRSWWANLWRRQPLAGTSVGNESDIIVALQWLVVICISYLVFAVQDWNLTDPITGLLITTGLLSAVILPRLPERILKRPVFVPGLVVLDSFLVVSALLLREQTSWDLLLLFFFCVFISAIGENLIQVGIGSILLSLLFLLFFSPNAKDASSLSPDLLIRVPFMFGMSIFYGYMTSQVRQEKKRMEQMEEAIRSRRLVICALAHDIKTPLNVIGGYAELLASDRAGPQNPAERLTYLKHVHENIDRVLQMVTDFLTVSKLETVGLEGANNLLQMNVIAEDVALQQMVTAREKNINLTLDVDPNLMPIRGDSSQLQRALANLVANAVKFTAPGGAIRIRSRMVAKNVAIEVTDTGPGIPREDVPRLFAEFKRLKGSADSEGSGLGLFIVKTIVEAHHGSVAVKSEEGVGTTFTMTFPAAAKLSEPDDCAHETNAYVTQNLTTHSAQPK